MKIVNRSAGCGIVENMLDDVKSLLNQGVLQEKITIISLNQNIEEDLKEKLSDISVYRFQKFVKNIFNKTPESIESVQFSEDLPAIYLLHDIIKLYTQNTELENLGKVSAFAREIYNLIGVLKANKVGVDDIKNACLQSNLNEKDSKRLEIVVKIYEQYQKFLKIHKFVDFRDIVISVSKSLKTNELLKKDISYRNEYIFVIGAENISEVQLEFLKEITDESKIFLYGDENARIETFMGASAFDVKNKSELKSEISLKKDILERALFVTNSQNKITTLNENIHYGIFLDFEDEMNFIAEDIKSSVKKFGYKNSDFAILTRDNASKQNVYEFLSYNNIQINSEQYNDDFQYFKFKMMNIISIFDIMFKLKIKNFDYDNFKKVEIKAKDEKNFVDLKVLSEQLNLFYESLLAEKIIRPYNLNVLKTLKLKEQEVFLPCSVLKNVYKIPQPDKNIIEEFNEKLKILYDFYKENRILELIASVSDINGGNEKSYEYNLFLAKFMKRVDEINRVKNQISENLKVLNPYSDCEKPNFDFQTINDLFDVFVKELQNPDGINISTIFEANGKSFKKVYIPNLVDEYFPKMTKTTSFISKDADKKISDELRKSGAKNFSHLIDSKDDDIRGEQSLMYVAMTCALEKLVLTTHKVNGGKNVLPSLFFEKLAYFDGVEPEKEILSQNKIDIEEIEVCDTKGNEEIEEKPPILEKNEKLHLSASQITNYQKCPKKFYYSNLLGIKGKSTFSASFGIAVHEILKIAYSNYLSDMNSKENTKKVLIELGNILFDSVQNDEALKKAVDAGFEYIDVAQQEENKNEKKSNILNQLRDLSILDIEIMRKDFLDTLDGLDKIVKYTGIKKNKDGSESKRGERDFVEFDFFSQIPVAAVCEKPFKFVFPKDYEIGNVEFSGVIDAFIKYGEGWNLLDYKTGSEEMKLFNQISDNNILFQNLDESILSEEDLQAVWSEKRKAFLNFKYQTVLYYFACLFDEKLKDEDFSKPNKLGYFYIRPQRKYDGSQEELIPVEKLQNLKNGIIKSLKNFVVTPVYESADFPASPVDLGECEKCFYCEICDVQDNNDN